MRPQENAPNAEQDATTPDTMLKAAAPATVLTDPAMLEKFLAVLAHDIKAPIRHLRMHLSDIHDACPPAQGSDDAHNLAQALSHSTRSLNRLKRIADKLSEYHISLLPPKPDAIALTTVFQEAQYKLQPLIDETGAQITMTSLPSVMGDREQLGLMATNLLENALLYHGQVAPFIRINATQSQTHQTITIEDNGQGIPDNQLDRVFEPFVRLHAKDVIEGAGLGLWIARTIAESHHMSLTLAPNDQAPKADLTDSPTPPTPTEHTATPTQEKPGCRAVLSWPL